MADSKNNKQDAGDLVLRRIDIAFAAVMLALASTLALAMLYELFGENSADFRNWMLGVCADWRCLFLVAAQSGVKATSGCRR